MIENGFKGDFKRTAGWDIEFGGIQSFDAVNFGSYKRGTIHS